mmetsp:Transcript_29070/g.81345  ORF Transcript_29070/g.81345 Transcript_29070/m.81345 type:complete len:265 (-) Transcript_29070:29-823(-)
MNYVWVVVVGVVVVAAVQLPGVDGGVTCGSDCDDDKDCTSDFTNPCTFCLSGVCSPLCGVGCGSDADCQTGGANPCTICNEKRICANPLPNCGTFCGGSDDACRYNGTGPCGGFNGTCCQCSTDYREGCVANVSTTNCDRECEEDSDCSRVDGPCVYCGSNNLCTNDAGTAMCGEICSGAAQCSGSTDGCTQCVGYFCSPPATCGQNCISSGQCQGYNPDNDCQACIGTICQDYEPCGGSCGDDSWCPPDCPVCNRVAKCDTSW